MLLWAIFTSSRRCKTPNSIGIIFRPTDKQLFMKILIVSAIALLTSFLGSANCNNAYASAGYGLSHAKKSMEANNFDHQQYYAERALQAFEKAKEQNESCGCPRAKDPILDGLENLNTALSQEKWDNARFYTKKALQNAEALLTSLDMCTLGQEPEHIPDPSQNDLASAEDMVILAEDTASADEWEAKMELKEMAEEKIRNLKASIGEVATLLKCDQALQALTKYKGMTEEELQAENLASVRSFYLSQVVALHNKALFAMLECSKEAP